MAESGAAAWVRRPERGTPGAFRALRWLALHAPERVSAAAVWLITLVFAAIPGRAENRASRAYLARVLGRPARFADVHRHAYAFGLVMRDRARFLAEGAAAVEIEATGGEAVHQALAAGRGAVLLGAHFGSFEALRSYDRMLPGLRVRYMMYEEAAARSRAAYAELNPEVAARVISLVDGPSAMLAAGHALSEGEFVAFLGDRVPDPGLRAQVAVPFLGGWIAVPTSPYLTAMTAEVPLILCFAPRIGRDRYAIEITPLHDGRPVPRAERAREAERLARAYAAALEDLCRRHPCNWFNFFDVWRAGEALRGAAP